MSDVDSFIGSNETILALRLGMILHSRYELEKSISLFDYELRVVTNGDRETFIHSSHLTDFEYYQRLGYIREEMVKPLHFYHSAEKEEDTPVSISEVIKLILESYEDLLTEWRESPYPRLRINIPMIDDKPFLSELVRDIVFEDKVYYETLMHEYLIPVEYLGPIQLGPHLDVTTFLEIRKALLIQSLLNIHAVSAFNDKHGKMSYNSLVKALLTKNLTDMLGRYGFCSESVTEFIDLVSWDVSSEPFYDLQYTPVISVADHSVVLPAAYATSNLLRNTQVSNKIRLEGQGPKFVEICNHLLQENFKNVVTEKDVKHGSEATDVDIALLSGNTLYLFECKYSIPPTSYHEMRGIWDDIQKGVRQLLLAKKILSIATKRKAYLNGWFPGEKIRESDEIAIRLCIINSHRIFAGMSLGEIAVRDFQSFRILMMDSGIGSSSINFGDGEITKVQYSPLSGSKVTNDDLNEYLSERARFFPCSKKTCTRWRFLRN